MLDAREWPGHAADRVAVAAWVCGENEGWLSILSNASHMFGVHGRPIDSDATNDLTGFVCGQVDEEEKGRETRGWCDGVGESSKRSSVEKHGNHSDGELLQKKTI